MKLLDNKTIIVTGTAKGIGKQMVESFVNEGADVIAIARTESEEHKTFCSNLSESYEKTVIPIYFDLCNEISIKNAVKEIKSTGRKINGLVNNAGVTKTALFQMTNMNDLRNVFETNFFGTFLFTQYIVKLMIRNNEGSIVNITSTAGIDGNSGKSAYGSSKAALICLSKVMSEELGGAGIRTNAICPGATLTPMLEENMHKNILSEEINSSALKKIGTTQDIACAATFLLSDLSSYITGQVIRVDGGVTRRNKGI